MRLFVAPYGNAGVAVNDAEADAANFATHPRKRVRRAPTDDLLGLAREPPEDAPPGVIRCLATTDQMELQVPSRPCLYVAPNCAGMLVPYCWCLAADNSGRADAAFLVGQAVRPSSICSACV